MPKIPGPVDVSADPRWGWNPLSRRYLKRSGEVWRRLVKAGVVQDEEVAEQLLHGAAGTKTKYVRGQNVIIQADRDAASDTVAGVFDPAKLTNAQLQQIATHIESMRITPAPAERRPTAAQRWKALQAAPTPTETETDLPDSSAYEDCTTGGSSDEEPPPQSAPIRVPRRTAPAASNRRARLPARY